MARGRKPLPTAVKELNGNPGKRKLNDAEPIAPPLASLDAPAWLSEDAKVIWNRRAHQVATMGCLKDPDTELFAAYCEAVANAVRANQAGEPAIKLWQLVRSLASEFGLSPSSRTRLHIPASRPENKLRLFQQARNHA